MPRAGLHKGQGQGLYQLLALMTHTAVQRLLQCLHTHTDNSAALKMFADSADAHTIRSYVNTMRALHVCVITTRECKRYVGVIVLVQDKRHGAVSHSSTNPAMSHPAV